VFVVVRQSAVHRGDVEPVVSSDRFRFLSCVLDPFVDGADGDPAPPRCAVRRGRRTPTRRRYRGPGSPLRSSSSASDLKCRTLWQPYRDAVAPQSPNLTSVPRQDGIWTGIPATDW
jgi:hypothetical protein